MGQVPVSTLLVSPNNLNNPKVFMALMWFPGTWPEDHYVKPLKFLCVCVCLFPIEAGCLFHIEV